MYSCGAHCTAKHYNKTYCYQCDSSCMSIKCFKVEISFRNSNLFNFSIPRGGPSTAVSVTHVGSAAPDSDLSEKCHSSETGRAAYLLPGAYDIVLCVDFIETTG